MTKKDYIKIADAIKRVAESSEPTDCAELVLRRVVNRLSDVMAGDNDRFRRHQFETACGAGTLFN